MTERLHVHFSLSCIGEGNGNLRQCSCLENPRDGRAWWAAVYGVPQSRTRLKRLSSSSSPREWVSLLAQSVKNLPAMQETRVRSLGREDPLEKEMATYSSTLAWRIPWTEEPCGLQSTGARSWTHLKQLNWRRKWQPTPVFLPGESHGWRSLVGCSPWGHPESDMTEAT